MIRDRSKSRQPRSTRKSSRDERTSTKNLAVQTSHPSFPNAFPYVGSLDNIYSVKFLEAITNGAIVKDRSAPDEVAGVSKKKGSSVTGINSSDVWNNNITLPVSLLKSRMPKDIKREVDTDDEDNTEEIDPQPDQVNEVMSSPSAHSSVRKIPIESEGNMKKQSIQSSNSDETPKSSQDSGSSKPSQASEKENLSPEKSQEKDNFPVENKEGAPPGARKHLDDFSNTVAADKGVGRPNERIQRASVGSGQSCQNVCARDGNFAQSCKNKSNPPGAVHTHYPHNPQFCPCQRCRAYNYCQSIMKHCGHDKKWFSRKDGVAPANKATCQIPGCPQSNPGGHQTGQYDRKTELRTCRDEIYPRYDTGARRDVYPGNRRASGTRIRGCSPTKYNDQLGTDNCRQEMDVNGCTTINPPNAQANAGYNFRAPAYNQTRYGVDQPVRYMNHPESDENPYSWSKWQYARDCNPTWDGEMDGQQTGSQMETTGNELVRPFVEANKDEPAYLGLPRGFHPGDVVAIRLYRQGGSRTDASKGAPVETEASSVEPKSQDNGAASSDPPGQISSDGKQGDLVIFRVRAVGVHNPDSAAPEQLWQLDYEENSRNTALPGSSDQPTMAKQESQTGSVEDSKGEKKSESSTSSQQKSDGPSVSENGSSTKSESSSSQDSKSAKAKTKTKLSKDSSSNPVEAKPKLSEESPPEVETEPTKTTSELEKTTMPGGKPPKKQVASRKKSLPGKDSETGFIVARPKRKIKHESPTPPVKDKPKSKPPPVPKPTSKQNDTFGAIQDTEKRKAKPAEKESTGSKKKNQSPENDAMVVRKTTTFTKARKDSDKQDDGHHGSDSSGSSDSFILVKKVTKTIVKKRDQDN